MVFRHAKPLNAWKVVLARVVDGKTEIVEWIRSGTGVIVTERIKKRSIPFVETSMDDLIARGFVEIEPNDTRKLAAEKQRVWN
ncbi:MAG: hypothetical protein U0798_14860 [Gemmataceae bacterium]